MNDLACALGRARFVFVFVALGVTLAAGQSVTLTPTSLSFPNQVLGTASSAQTVTLKNGLTVALKITSIVATLPDYTQTNTCPISPSTLAAGKTCTISVTFTPSALGVRSGSLKVTDGASNSPQTVTLTGTGIAAVTATPTSLSFAKQALGTSSAAQTVTLTNNQSTALTFKSIASSLADFGVTSTTCPTTPATLPAGASCTASVTFSPKATGTRSGTLSFTDSANNSPQTVSLSGTGAPATLVSISVSPATASIALGTTQQFAATGTYSNGTTQTLTSSVTWTSSSSTVATINSGGLATSVAQGTATITAASGTISGSATLTVSAPTLKSIAVTPSKASIPLGTTQQFAATGTYSNGSTQNLTSSVTWTSSSTTVATVSNVGLATSVAQGSATITAASGTIKGSAALTVAAPALASIAVTPATASIALGTTQQFASTGTYTNGTQKTLTSSVTWTSSSAAVASVNASGLATSLAQGVTTMTATSGTVAGSASLTVTAPLLKSISVTPATASIPLGTTQQFTAIGTYSNGSTQNLTTSVTWTSSSGTVASISSSGLASSLAQGSTTITAASGTISGSASLTVTAPALVSIAITPTTASIALGTTQQFAATGTYSNGSTQNLTTSVTWTSSSPTVATVSSAGLASSLAQGATTITATSGTISGSASLTVTAPALVSISVTPATASIPSGTTQQFTATGTYTNGSTQNLTSSATWSSSSATVASVSSSGLASGTGQGSATITAAAGTISGSATLNVAQPALVSIAITPANATFALGTTQALRAIGTYTDGSTLDITTTVSWSTLNSSIATVNAQGVAASVAVGSTSVSATLGSTVGTTTLTVNPATLVSIAVTPAIPMIPLGTTVQFTATGTFTDGSTQNVTDTVQWSSDTTTVATISNNTGSQGLASSVETGTANITATSGSVQGTTTLTVTTAALVSIAVTPANPTIALGTTQQFVATGTYTDGTTQNLTSTATWSSDTPSSATINTAGLASSAGVGTATISATANNITGSTLLSVTPAQLVSIAVTPPTASIPLGTMQAYDAVGTYTDGTTQDVTQVGHWSSTNAAAATISNTPGSQGLASTLGTGTTTISIAIGTVSGTATLTVNPAALLTMTLNPQTPTIALGTTQQFTATGTYTDGSVQDLTTTAQWSSSSATVAVMSTTGLATSAGTGTATITATQGTVTASTTLTVGQAAIVSLAVSPAASTIPLGTTQQFQAIATYTDGTTQDLTASASWSSSVPGVAAVNATGLANSLSAGTTTISASSGGTSGGSVLTVTPAVAVSLALTPPTASIAFNGQQQFQAFLTYSDGSVQNVTSLVAWSSSAPAIATITSTGLATGIASGSTIIYASAGNGMIVGSVLTVAPPPLVSIAVSPTNPTLALSSSQQFTATGTFADGSTQNLTGEVTWTSSNSNVVSIGSSGLATALQFGISTITASSGDISGTDAVTVPTVSAIPSSLFDMTINKASTPWPTDTFYGQRLLGTNTLWGNLETANGVYNWTTLNKFVSNAQAHGVDLVYTFLGVPQWASSNPNDASCSSWPGSCDPPNDLNSDGTGSNAQWDAFVTNIATQVGTKIKYWELWDEPNIATYANPKTWTTAQWIRMASDARQIIRGINPNAVILSPGIQGSTTWLTNFLAAGGGSYVDVIAFHGYANPPETVASQITSMRSAMAAGGVGSLPLWDTEASWGLDTVLPDPNMQAGSVARLYLLHAANNIGRLYWYGWDFSNRGTLWQLTSSTNCETPNNSGYICLAGIAYAQVHNWMTGAVLSGCSSSGTIWTCNLSRPGGYFADVMWDSSQSCSNGVCQTTLYTPPPQFIQYRDLYGNTHSITGTVPLGAEPVILENQSAGETIQSQFFGMGVASASDMPKVSYGTLSHPPLAWTAIEGSARGTYNFGTTDALVENAPKDSNGVALIDLALGWTPPWALANQSSCANQGTTVGCTAPPDNIQDWINFVASLINHYNGITAPHVKYYEIWNEANTSAFWTGSVSSLITMAQTAYPILKQDPYSFVLTPSVVWNGGTSFMSAFLQGGGASYADGVTFHGYTSQTGKGFSVPVPLPESTQSTNATIQQMIPAFREVADSNGMQGKPLMTTEGGGGVGGVTDPDMQAAWIAHYELVQAGLASGNNLQFQTWFSWGQAASGTIETSQGTPTEAGNAYQQVHSWLVGNQASPCANAGNIWACPVSANLVVWDSSQTCSNGVCTTSSYTPPAGYDHYIDLTGAAYSITGTIALGVKPVMLENWSSLAATLVSITVTPTNPSLAMGSTIQFTVSGNYSNGNTENLTSSATWTSSASAVATITSSGLSTGVATGTTTIVASVNGITGTATLTVVPLALVSVTVTPANASISVGNMRQFAAIGTFSDGSTQNLTTSVTWISSSSVVAGISNSVGSQGLATADTVGTSTIEASLGTYYGMATLTVTPPLSQGTLTQYLTTWGGLQRIYYLYTPKVVAPTPSLVVFLHATYAMTSIPLSLVPQWEAIADQYGALIVWPISTYDPSIQSWRWDCDGCESGFAVAPDDSGFIRSVILSMQNQYGISPGQTFVAGMSSGGFMTQRIGMEQSDVIAAIAPVSGAQYIQPVGSTLVPHVVPNPISVYRLNGDADPVVPYCGGTKGFWAGVVAYSPSMDQDSAFWSGTQSNSCTTFSQSQPMCTDGEPTEGVNGQDATECKGGTEVIFEREIGVGHVWVTGTEVKVWAFFQTHGR